MPEDESMPEKSKNPFSRLRSMPGRPLLLIVVGLLLLVVVLRGGCSGVDVSESQAIATARATLEAHPGSFTPERTEAKVLRQGFPPTAMWIVVFTVLEPDGGPGDFLRHAAIWVDAGTGEIRQVNVSESDDS